MTTDTGNGWNEKKALVMDSLKRIEKTVEDFREEAKERHKEIERKIERFHISPCREIAEVREDSGKMKLRVENLEESRKDRKQRDRWLIGIGLTIVGLLAGLLVTSCNGNGGNGGTTTTTVLPTCELWSAPDGCECPDGTEVSNATGLCSPPRADRPIDWGIASGATSFSLALRDAKFIDEWARWHRDHGWPVLRVGAQTSYDWCRANVGYLPCGPEHGTDEWKENLVRLLDVTARRQNVWVQLIPTFTYKSHDAGSQEANVAYFSEMFDRVNQVVLAGGYKHVIWEAFNEVVHPLSQHIKDEDVLAIMEHMKENTYLPIGTDYHGGLQSVDLDMVSMEFSQDMSFERRFQISDRLYQEAMRRMEWRGRYPYIWRDVVDYIAFHPPRNPEPTLERMREVQAKFKYRKPVLIDETVSWASQENIDRYGLKGKGTIAMNGYGTEDERMAQCVAHLRNIHRTKNENGLRWRPFFHSIWEIESAEIGRIPTYATDIEQ